MTLTRPWAIDAAFPNAADQRKQLGAIYPREGVFPDPITVAAAGIAYAGTGWGVNARPFVAAIKRGGAPYSQAYGTALVSNDAVVTNAWTIGAAPVSGSRIDLLCIRARDTTQGDPTAGAPTDGPGGAARTGFPEFLVVAGTAGTTPARPSVPAGYEEVGSIQTPSGAASTAGSTIIHSYNFAHVIGGTLYFRTFAALRAYTNTAVLIPGMDAVALDTPTFRYVWSGTRWSALSTSSGIIPTGVSGGTIGPGGRVDFSGVSTVRLDGVFGADYEDYEIEWSTEVTGGSFDFTRLSSGGTIDATAGRYGWNRITLTGSNSLGSAVSPAGETSWGSMAASGYPRVNKRLRLSGPALARHTRVSDGHAYEMHPDGSQAMVASYGGWHNQAAAYDGFALQLPSGTMAGWIRVRGIA